ncbi:MAG: carboxypeptidase regulatory-like domain-containing protein [Candidatus Acidiferrales bacterium]
MRIQGVAPWFRGLLLVVVLVLAGTRVAVGQNENGSIAGRVVDQQGEVVPGATVTATSTTQKFRLSATTDAQGQYVLPGVPPGAYSLAVVASGFQKFEEQNVVLHTSQKVAIPTVSLRVGTVSETVTVTAQQAALQTENAERTGTVEGQQIQNDAVNGRTPLTLVGLLPGVSGVPVEETANTGGISEFSANGVRNNSNNLTINGIGDIDIGLNGVQNVTLSLDSIQEFTVLTGVYQAQYGRSSGAQVNMITKSGTSQFHGSAYLYHRNESLNANNAFLKEEAATIPGGATNPAYNRPLFRLNDIGYTIGGPIYIPDHFNTHKDKLFFFWSEEFQRQLLPGAVANLWIPTAAEATGDFSADATPGNPNGNLIRDPNTGLACSPGATSASPGGCFDGLKDGVPTLGVIPANRLWGPGLTWMTALSALNPAAAAIGTSGSGNTFNYSSPASVNSSQNPRREDLLRLDFTATSKLRLFGTYIHNSNTSLSYFSGGLAPSTSFPLSAPYGSKTPGYQWNVGGTYIFNSTTVDDFEIGVSNNSLQSGSTPLLLQSGSGLTGANAFPLLYPNASTGFIPSISYGSNALAGSGATTTTADAPFLNYNTDIDVTDNLSKVWGQHSFKTGIYVQRSRKNQTAFADANGNYGFGSSSANPYDTGNGLANLALGIFSTFDQANSFLTGEYRYTNFEGYVQDTWKITPNITLDYGVRLSWYQPQYDALLQMSNFIPSLYNPANAPVLYRPTNAGCPASFPNCAAPTPADVGLLIPGSGNLEDGIVQGNQGISKYLQDSRAPQIGPRAGIAWDVTGKQQVVIRTGAGIYYDRVQGNRTFELIQNPPESIDPTFSSGGCVNSVGCPSGAPSITPGGGFLAPPTIYATDIQGKIPTVYEYSFEVESKLPGQMILDTAYVGSASRHLTNELNLNGIPYGTTFQASAQDPTQSGPQCLDPATVGFEGLPGGYSGACALPENLVRPMQGLGDVWDFTNTGNANYNSLQVSLNKQVGRSLTLGASYTYSKNLTDTPVAGFVGADFSPVRIDGRQHQAFYTYAPFDQRHNFVVNYVYNFPSIFKSNGLAHTLLDGWQISGITRFTTGNPFPVSFDEIGVGDNLDLCITDCFNLFGGPFGQSTLTGSYTETARIALTGQPIVGVRGGGGPLNRLNPAAFTTPSAPSLGLESPYMVAFGPGINNWDMSLQKNFAFAERYVLEMRIDAFNAFNHTQWAGVNSLAVYLPTPGGPLLLNGPSGAASDTTAFGNASAARDPRILQLVARFRF